MKQFLFLDTDIVNSIIAQSEKGLITEISSQQESGKSKKKSRLFGTKANANVGGSLWKFAKAETGLSVGGDWGNDQSEQFTSREMMAKTLHDAAFDVAYAHIKPTEYKLGNDNADEYGLYVELRRVFNFVDLDYLENLFYENGLIDFIKKRSRDKIQEEIDKTTSNMNREQLRKAGNAIKTEIQKLVTASDKQYDDIHGIITAFKQLIPYSKMMISSDGYLVPLDDKYFRINPENLGFKYGGEITCVGIITNIIGADTDPCDNKNIFATLQFTVNEALRAILPTNKDNLCVIHPIAVFYG